MNKAILIAAIVAVGLAACGKEEVKPAPAPVPAPKVEAPKVEVPAAVVDAAKDAAGKTVEAAKDANCFVHL